MTLFNLWDISVACKIKDIHVKLGTYAFQQLITQGIEKVRQQNFLTARRRAKSERFNARFYTCNTSKAMTITLTTIIGCTFFQKEK